MFTSSDVCLPKTEGCMPRVPLPPRLGDTLRRRRMFEVMDRHTLKSLVAKDERHAGDQSGHSFRGCGIRA